MKLAAEQAKKQRDRYRVRRTCSSRSGRSCAPALWRSKGCNGTDEDVLTYAMFPQVAPKFFATRAEGPKNLGKDPAAAWRPAGAPQPAAEWQAARCASLITYDVTVNGRTHKVTVAPRSSGIGST